MSYGRSLELYFADGTPDGILTAEMFGWTGHVIKVPRLRLQTALKRPEAAFTGVYFLIGMTEEGPRTYIGEAESIAKRIKDHDSKRDWWTDAILVTTSADALNKAHVKYLEARLIQMAREANAATLENGVQPEGSSLNEAATANIEAFLENLLIVLPAIGVEIFKSGKRTESRPDTQGAAALELFELSTPKTGVKGLARLDGSDFVVQSGSVARRQWAGKGEHDFGYKRLHEKLLAEGILEQRDGHAVFIRAYAFNSPSAAAAVMNGRPANGRIEWRQKGSGITFADWEIAQLAEGTA